METKLTYESVLNLITKLSESQAKTDAQLAATDAQLAATDAQLAATDAQLAATDAQLRANAIAQAKNEEQFAKTDAKLDRLAKLYGGVADNMGSSAEEYFYNSLAETKRIGSIQFDDVYEKVVGGKPGAQQEYDILMLNGGVAAIVEVKYKVHTNAIEQLQNQLRIFKTHFPEYASMQLYGGIAGFSIPDEVAAAAKAQGLFVLKRKGDLLEVEAQNMRAF